MEFWRECSVTFKGNQSVISSDPSPPRKDGNTRFTFAFLVCKNQWRKSFFITFKSKKPLVSSIFFIIVRRFQGYCLNRHVTLQEEYELKIGELYQLISTFYSRNEIIFFSYPIVCFPANGVCKFDIKRWNTNWSPFSTVLEEHTN